MRPNNTSFIYTSDFNFKDNPSPTQIKHWHLQQSPHICFVSCFSSSSYFGSWVLALNQHWPASPAKSPISACQPTGAELALPLVSWHNNATISFILCNNNATLPLVLWHNNATIYLVSWHNNATIPLVMQQCYTTIYKCYNTRKSKQHIFGSTFEHFFIDIS